MIVKMALALPQNKEAEYAARHPNIFPGIRRVVKTPDDTYVVHVWDFPDFHEWDLGNLKTDLDKVRHSLIEITDEGIFTDVIEADDDGVDEEFLEILGWNADICLWQDETQTLTGDTQTDLTDAPDEDMTWKECCKDAWYESAGQIYV